MAEKTCPHGQPVTSFCKRCERGEAAPEQASTARMSLGRKPAASAFAAHATDQKPPAKRKAKRRR